MADQNSNNNQQLYYAGIAAVVIVVLIALWLFFAKENTPPPAVNLLPPETTLPVAAEPEPVIEAETGLAEPEETIAVEPEPQTTALPPEPAIPPLNESDAEVKQRLLALDWRPGLAALFVTEDMLRSFAVQVDNIAQGQLAKGFTLLKPLEQKFAVEPGAAMQLDDRSFARYQPYIQLLESVPPQQIIKLFNRYEPLLQQAHAEQGYPDELFKNKLIAAIDLLLATPEVSYPLALKRPAVIYEFADPAIEQLPAAQKQMIRLGPVNQQKVKTLLRQYRSLLTQR